MQDGFTVLLDIEDKLKGIISGVLKDITDVLSLDRSFLDLGINSVLAVEVIEAVNQKLDIDLGIEAVFDYNDIKELAAHIFEKYGDICSKNEPGMDGQEAGEERTRQPKRDSFNKASEFYESVVKEALAEILNESEGSLDLDRSFLELGINSVLTVELVEAINKKLGIDLGVDVVFDYIRAKEVGVFIYDTYGTMPAYMESEPGSEDSLDSCAPKDKTDTGSEIIDEAISSSPSGPSRILRNSDIAIVGISGKIAKAETIEEFWDYLQSGKDCIEEIRRKGWNEREYYNSDQTQRDKSISKWGGLLKDIEKFDASFFNISPLEAERMDPQQRLFMEEAFKAFEDSGYCAEELSGKKVGVFVGGRSSDYKERTFIKEEINSQTFLGSDMSILTARISYFLNLKGPSLAIDTACSSSLTAIHLACESIRRGESHMALAGGVFVMSSPEFYAMTSKTAMLSPDGKCKTFDNSANGIVVGEGVGAVILKPIEAAVKDGDHIYGVIKGSGINQDGKTKGITAPSMLSQKVLLAEVYKNADIHPETISYIEAHGTGTKLGDPIEVKALTEAFRMFTDKKQFCAIGSHKPNFGHTIMSAGIAGVFKILMAMKYRKIPPTINIKEVNEHIDFDESPFFINTAMKDWKTPESIPMRAGVSSFGFSGTNCHIIIEEAPFQCNSDGTSPYYFFPFSAKSKTALKQKIADMAEWLEREGENYSIADISYTLSTCRSHFTLRCAFVAEDINELKRKIEEFNKSIVSEDYIGNGESNTFPADMGMKEYGESLIEELLGCVGSDRVKYLKKLWALSDLFIKGYDLRWRRLFELEKRKRVPLPAYPFKGESYWVPGEWKSYRSINNEHEGIVNPLSHLDGSATMETNGTLMLRAGWKEGILAQGGKAIEYVQRLVVLCELDGMTGESIERGITGSRCMCLKSEQNNIGRRFHDYTLLLFKEIRRILEAKPKGYVLIQVVADVAGERQLLMGFSGLLKTARRENPNIVGQIIGLENDEDNTGIINRLEENRNTYDVQVLYKGGKRWIPEWSEIKDLAVDNSIPWKDGGIYVITGGAGKLGRVFAREIAGRVKNPVVIMAGRSKLDKVSLERLEKEFEALGARLRYKQTDITQGDDVITLMQDIREEFGGINGIIHGAGIIRDNFIIRKSEAEFQEVLAPKVTGLVNLDEASKKLNLDFFVLFSSISGCLGNAGQADYAAANSFMDFYALYRGRLVEMKERSGKTLSINWPLWRDGGMGANEEVEEILRNSMGLLPMDTNKGIDAFYKCMSLHSNIIAVAEGELKRLRDAFANKNDFMGEAPSNIEIKPVDGDGQELFKERAVSYFKRTLGAIIKLQANQIGALEPFEKYGIDSIIIVQATNELEKKFGPLSKTLFFEYKNIQELTDFFLQSYRGKLAELLGMDEKAETSAGCNAPAPMEARNRERLRLSEHNTSAKTERDTQDIAVIGLAGRYPGARNVREFWDILKNGKDCITEIPEERWNPSIYFDEDKDMLGKTCSKWGGFIDGVDQFDPLFFNISPREAELMDPQERLFLQCVYEALEDAGYTRESLSYNTGFGLSGNVGVYVGAMYEDYQLYGVEETLRGRHIALGGILASIANRVSYFCNFHGPSMAVDTMCSSSLTAIHMACHSLEREECDVAVAGGVNISVHPNKYLLLAQGKFASSKGRCESFGKGGDGYVPGEGVGAVLLKPLTKAIADGDHIYGIIKATAINHGGKNNGYTVPNPNAQASVILRSFKEAGIDPRSISYIEAHGTGTSLGDPIEITGLTKAFQEYTEVRQFCSIGSAKSNIGHCESAAGIAGLTKVLLQLKYCQLAPSLHSKVLNPNIDFIDTPFVVQQELVEWTRPIVEINGEMKECPRISGISSFGAGGANAHIIVEEYIPGDIRKHQSISVMKPAIIVLSARSREQLKDQAQQLLHAIGQDGLDDSCLADMAYTLQVGREAMEERLAVIVTCMDDLKNKLGSFVEDGSGIEDLYAGQVKRNKGTVDILAMDEDMAAAIDAWISKRKYGKLLELWVKGWDFDWTKLYIDNKPQRISLPTYPFARERYWFSASRENSAAGPVSVIQPGALIHPVLHKNTSDFCEQRYTSNFTGLEFFLSDHIVNGNKTLPAVVYLEMARAALKDSIREFDHKKNKLCLKNVTWTKLVTVGDHPVDVHIGLYPEESGEFAFEIYSETGLVESERIIHCQGSAILAPLKEGSTIDLRALQGQFGQEILSSGKCYEIFRGMGIQYGPGHQGIEMIYTVQDQALAKLSVHSSVKGKAEQFVLHPCIMDSALQASIALGLSHTNHEIRVPFAIDEIEILSPCTGSMWAVIRYSGDSEHNDITKKIDIDICDEMGNLCIRIKRFSSRTLNTDAQTEPVLGSESIEDNDIQDVGNIMLAPVWDCIKLDRNTAWALQGQVVMTGNTGRTESTVRKYCPEAGVLAIRPDDSIDTMTEKLKEYGHIDHILWVMPESASKSPIEDLVIEEQEQGVLCCFRMVKSLLRLGYGSRDLGWTIITTQTQGVLKQDLVNPAHASLHGLIGSMAKEYPNWKIRSIDMEAHCQCPIEDILFIPADPDGNPWAYRGQEWYRQKLILLKPEPASGEQGPYRTDGVYVVIGGAGGIGEVWSEYIIRAFGAQIIWIGRREKDEAIRSKLDRLATIGPAPQYIKADASDRESLQKAYQEIKKKYSHINGVIHSAIVLMDQSLMKMDENRFRDALSAKVDVSVRLGQVFANEPLDFVLFFSSFISFAKNPGQSNYASGCTFKDAFAQRLSVEWPCAVKVMNWGYWGSIGIVASEAYKERMAQAGIGSIEPEEAFNALEALMVGPMDQIAFIKTTKPMAVKEMDRELGISVCPQAAPNIMGILQEVHNRGESGEHTLGVTGQVEKAKELENILVKLLKIQLVKAGLIAGNKLDMEGVKGKISRIGYYSRWIEESISVLVKNNYLKADGKTFTVNETTMTDAEDIWEEWEQRKKKWVGDPDIKAKVILVDKTLRALPEILTGKQLATDVMFTDSSMKLVEGIYKENPVADYFNETVADIAAAYVRERLKQEVPQKIRIIEIGAGTGGTSAMVFKKLKPYCEHIQEYCYTDISRAFLIHAEKEYGAENPFLNYKIFNVEEPATGQGIPLGEYDIAIATNVLHATKNIRRTLRNAKAVLKKNGVILLNEMNSNTLFTHLTFGLLEGWWLYEDDALRIPGCPGLYAETWKEILENEGLAPVFFPAKEAHELGQQIIAAKSDGVVRQKLPKKPQVVPVKNIAGLKPVRNEPLKQKASTMQAGGATIDMLREKSTAYIKKMVGEILKIPVDRIDSSEALERYGIDSIMVMQVTNALRKVLDNISSTLLFEHQTIDALVEHLINTQKDSLARMVGLEDKKDDNEWCIDEMPVNPAQAPSIPHIKSRCFMQTRGAGTNEPEHRACVSRDIAIIGLAGRYPGAKDVGEFWNNLKQGKNCISEIPKDRWNWEEYFDKDKGKKGKVYTKWGGFIEDIDKFDPLFFQISPAEAERMDPQERLFLQTAHASIEDAGYTPSTLCEGGKVGIYVGVMNGNYPTGSYYWSIANRVSYIFNFQGPSMAVDTACSSSLTAVHLAVESLREGTSECAIAGGVNLIVDPIHYVRLSAMTMLSSGDRCKAFGEQADGFVDGEGVGAIVLKPLQKAVEDGDHIYGIIKGSTLNAGGKTNGYTVPNPNAQYQLVAEGMKRSGVHARTVSYIEAHGTGTALGDPIEVSGLTKAFEADTKDRQFCAIGSVKSNIGHCESAAGIAGVTKVLLQLKYRQLAPSLHSKVLNPNIDFSNTPFVVQQELAEWKRPVIGINREAREYPRIAGISSFGAGGANAHIIIEEYIPKGGERHQNTVNPGEPSIIVLSARNEERLNEQVKRFLATLREQSFSDRDLTDMAYTLQVGREAREERLAVIAGSVKELEEKLRDFAEGRIDIYNLYRGTIKRDKDTLSVLASDEEMQDTILRWIQLKKFGRLADLWTKGLNFDWNKLYGEDKPNRISLPTYPFARERYWMAKADAVSVSDIKPYPGISIHPMLHQNISNFYEQRFSTVFTGQEFFLADHIVKGRKVLPGVAYIEMAREAVSQAVDAATAAALKKGRTVMRFKNVTWQRPLIVGEQAVRANIQLFLEDNGEIAYEISCGDKDTGEDTGVCSQGSLMLEPVSEIPVLDIGALQGECSGSSLCPAQLYEAFRSAGIDYGPGHKGIEKIYAGHGKILVKLSLPSSVSGMGEQFLLHPSLMDSALQASAALIMESGGFKSYLPFAMKQLEIFSSCTPSMWALARLDEGVGESKSQKDAKDHKINIDLCDETGKVCVRINGLSARVLDGELQTGETLKAVKPEAQNIMLGPVWDSIPLSSIDTSPCTGENMVIIGGDEAIRSALQRSYPKARVLDLNSSDGIEAMIRKLDALNPIGHILWIVSYHPVKSLTRDELVGEHDVLAAFRMIKALLSLGYGSRELSWSLITTQAQFVRKSDVVNPSHASIHGLIGSLAKEYTRWKLRLADMEADCDWPLDEILSLPVDPEGNAWAYRAREWYRQKLVPVKLNGIRTNGTLAAYRSEGVYVVIGGAGGIGEVWSEYMMRTYKAQIVWVGRREKDAGIQAKIDRLAVIGPAPCYITADAADCRALQKAYEEIKTKYSQIHGVVHSAIALLDQSLANMDEERFKAGFSAKAGVSMCIAQVFQKEPLDFVMFFSSMVSFVKTPGQSNYSAGCTFKDAFAQRLSQEWPCAVKVMNWGYWGSAGVVASKVYKDRMMEAGMGSIEPEEAMEALEMLLAGPVNQIAFMKTAESHGLE